MKQDAPKHMSILEKKIPGWASMAAIGGAFALLFWLERRRPLRPEAEDKATRVGRNLAVAVASAVAVQLLERPVVEPLTELVQRRRWGLLKRVRLPAVAEVALAGVLLDYTLYAWHVLTHKVPWLWRFHVVHHLDRDMDASTALRFHFAEIALSVPWRAAQIAAIGVAPLSFSTWQLMLFLAILFHHANLRLPIALERRLNLLVVTPRMHGIHHSRVPEEANANWSSGLTVWDWLHGTLRLNVPQDAVTTGVPAYDRPEDRTLPRILALPFGPEPDSWRSPDGSHPAREPLAGAATRLLP